MDKIININNVTKDYGQGDVIVHALRGINLSLERGEFTSMAGPSGSGKSTLLNIIGGLDKPTTGSVEVDDRDVVSMSMAQLSHLRRDSIGFIFQNYSLIPVLTAYENAEYILVLQGVSAKKRQQKIMDILKEVGLESMKNRFPRELSGGQQQRVAIARAIAPEPSLILADEPTANVDSKTGGALMDLMRKLNEEKGITFLLSTHEKTVMERARRLVVLKDGLIEYDGSPKEGIDIA